MKDIVFHKSEIPPCDICVMYGVFPARLGVYDSPTRRTGDGAGRWANLCDTHLDTVGIKNARTSELVVRRVPQEEAESTHG